MALPGNVGLVLLYDLVFWAPVQPCSGHDRLVSLGTGGLARPVRKLAGQRLSLAVFTLFQKPAPQGST